MKFIYHLLFTLICCWLLSAFADWRFAFIIPFIAAYFFQLKNAQSFLAGFLALFLMWGISATLIDIANNSLLSVKVGGLLGVQSSFLLILVTAILGGLIGGISSLLGTAFSKFSTV